MLAWKGLPNHRNSDDDDDDDDDFPPPSFHVIPTVVRNPFGKKVPVRLFSLMFFSGYDGFLRIIFPNHSTAELPVPATYATQCSSQALPEITVHVPQAKKLDVSTGELVD